MNTTEVDYSKVTDIYTGKNNCCRCGCRGRYFLKGEKGYVKALNKFKKLLGEGNSVERGGSYINLGYGNDRAITLYFED